jgi:CheY-like chemotaxis protein
VFSLFYYFMAKKYLYRMQSATPSSLLFIDDDPDDGETMKTYITQLNPAINFVQVFDGWDAIMHLKKLAYTELPRLIVLDINMRIINGFEFLKVVKGEERYKDIPVIVYSTSTKAEDKNQSIALGAVNYFSKPDTVDKVKKIAGLFAAHFAIPATNTTLG